MSAPPPPHDPDFEPDDPTDWHPLEPEDTRAQIRGLLDLLGSAPGRVLDLGCGSGRILVPLVGAGHRVVGLDRDPRALAACEAALGRAGAPSAGAALLVRAEFDAPPNDLSPGFDAILCLGHTLMEWVDVDAAVERLRRVASLLRPGGFFAIDDFPHALWAEVAEGYWQTGVSEDGGSQLIWLPGDAVFVLRFGEAVDPDGWEVTPEDRRLRLWSTGALRLAARLAGLTPPRRRPEDRLMVMERPVAERG